MPTWTRYSSFDIELPQWIPSVSAAWSRMSSESAQSVLDVTPNWSCYSSASQNEVCRPHEPSTLADGFDLAPLKRLAWQVHCASTARNSRCRCLPRRLLSNHSRRQTGLGGGKGRHKGQRRRKPRRRRSSRRRGQRWQQPWRKQTRDSGRRCGAWGNEPAFISILIFCKYYFTKLLKIVQKRRF